MRIKFIRHAESANNYAWYQHRDDTDRVCDPPITEMGQQQVAALRGFLAGNKEDYAFTRMFISPFLRTLQTAAAFDDLYPDIPKTVWTWVHEGGACFTVQEDPHDTIGEPGMSRSEIEALYPQFGVSEEITEAGWNFHPKVESYSYRYYRANYVIETLIKEYGETDEMIAIVSHGGFHNHLINAIMKVTKQCNLWIELENTGISSFYYGRDYGGDNAEGWWRIDYLNRCEWLSNDLRRDCRVYS